MAEMIRKLLASDEYNASYGRNRIYKALLLYAPPDMEIPSERTVYRIMQRTGLVHKRRRSAGITKADRNAEKSDDLLKRDFSADKPFDKCVTDITEVKGSDGKLYVSVIFDCFDNEAIGLALRTNMKAGLCVETLESAYKAHPELRGAIIHSDRGSQYTSRSYRHWINYYDIRQSMNSAGGRCHDNAKCESMWARMKSELFYDRGLKSENFTIAELRVMIWRYFMIYWNTAFQPLVQEDESVLLPIQTLDPIPSPSAEQEQRICEWVQVKLLLNQDRKAIDPFPQIRVSAGNVDMHYTGTLYRNPYEPPSPMLEITQGCTHNACKFCTMYKDVPFRMSPLEWVEEDLQEIASYAPNIQRLQLIGADPFCMSFSRLDRICDLAHQYLPQVKIMTMAARVDNVKNKTVEELRILREKGMVEVNLGVESGDNWTLQRINKGYHALDILEQTRKLDEAGMKYNSGSIVYTEGEDE